MFHIYTHLSYGLRHYYSHHISHLEKTIAASSTTAPANSYILCDILLSLSELELCCLSAEDTHQECFVDAVRKVKERDLIVIGEMSIRFHCTSLPFVLLAIEDDQDRQENNSYTQHNNYGDLCRRVVGRIGES